MDFFFRGRGQRSKVNKNYENLVKFDTTAKKNLSQKIKMQ